jgi:hypothetical protein
MLEAVKPMCQFHFLSMLTDDVTEKLNGGEMLQDTNGPKGRRNFILLTTQFTGASPSAFTHFYYFLSCFVMLL